MCSRCLLRILERADSAKRRCAAREHGLTHLRCGPGCGHACDAALGAVRLQSRHGRGHRAPHRRRRAEPGLRRHGWATRRARRRAAQARRRRHRHRLTTASRPTTPRNSARSYAIRLCLPMPSPGRVQRLPTRLTHVRFTPENGHHSAPFSCPLSARNENGRRVLT
jgi:hypothetical protein